MQVLRFYVRPGPPEQVGGPTGGAGGAPPGLGLGSPLRVARAVEPGVTAVTCELCYYLAWDGETPPDAEEGRILRWLLGSPLGGGEEVAPESFLRPRGPHLLLEIGPRLGVSTAASTNAVSLCRAGRAGPRPAPGALPPPPAPGGDRGHRGQGGHRDIGDMGGIRGHGGIGDIGDIGDMGAIRDIGDFEGQPPAGAAGRLGRALRDPMTEQLYPEPLTTFEVPVCPRPCHHHRCLAFDPWDVQYYTRLFRAAGRNPTSVECFDLAQSNSEHSRHWFFKGRLVVDGQEKPQSLFQSIMGTQSSSNPNNVIKFSDNSSAIRGVPVTALWPRDPAKPSPFEKRTTIRHVIFTAETHNFPTAVAPFSGATTGTGGRIRDVQCTGRGAHVIAGTAGYSFGNLLIPGYELPWEDGAQPYPKSFARPLEIAIRASDGASDYGNKFGEPVLAGFARSFGQVLPGGQRREWIKPIMFSGGIGAIEDDHVRKEPPEPGMLVVKVGGPVYRIGVGGGAASSIQVQGDNAEERDAGAVQRGDAEMEQKMNRVLRGCIESGGGNPICSIHDQGAGGNGNVLKELSEPAGAVIYASRFQRGDPTLSVLELWGAEYQESNALLVRPPRLGLLRRLAARERCPLCVVGTVTGDGRIVLVDDLEAPVPEGGSHEGLPTPVNLELEWVLGKMPRKEFVLQRVAPTLRPLALPPGLSVRQALERVLRLPAVASKRYLTNKVDRSVTGLVAQQQCVGPLHTPLADVAVVALSHFDTVGAATALGEQPIKGLLDPAAGARLALTEALTNLVFARITDLRDVKCSGNWMWGAKTGAEGGALVAACEGLVGLLHRLGVAIDGGKDSLSMAARVGTETVLAPGTLVVSAYAVCPDITATVTPDLKCPDGKGALLWVQLSPGRHRLGGSALAQVFSQLGDACPDLEDPEVLAAAFRVTQRLIEERGLSAGHDVSDGGLLGCLLEMAFAGNCGLQVDVATVPSDASPLAVLFAEEPGLVLEVPVGTSVDVCRRYQEAGVRCVPIGHSGPYGPDAMVQVVVAMVVAMSLTIPVSPWQVQVVVAMVVAMSLTIPVSPWQVQVVVAMVVAMSLAIPVSPWQVQVVVAMVVAMSLTIPVSPWQVQVVVAMVVAMSLTIPVSPWQVQVVVAGTSVLSEPVGDLRGLWEETSFRLEREQAAPDCVAQEEAGLRRRWGPTFTLTFDPLEEPPLLRHMELPGPRVAVLREEGSNGDREMAAAFVMAGFQ
ncbi:hypothetical protein QYF61_011707, partial [Mycteria americana]